MLGQERPRRAKESVTRAREGQRGPQKKKDLDTRSRCKNNAKSRAGLGWEEGSGEGMAKRRLVRSLLSAV